MNVYLADSNSSCLIIHHFHDENIVQTPADARVINTCVKQFFRARSIYMITTYGTVRQACHDIVLGLIHHAVKLIEWVTGQMRHINQSITIYSDCQNARRTRPPNRPETSSGNDQCSAKSGRDGPPDQFSLGAWPLRRAR